MLLPNLPPPVEGVRHQSQSIDAYITRRCLGTGTLYIAESRLSWVKDNSTAGLSLEYPHIAIHAVSRDISSFDHPCLYLMLDINIDDRSAANGYHDGHSGIEDEDEDDNDNDDGSEMTEIRFVPSDPSLLDFMYKALNECQVLHPDPEDQPSDEGEDDEGEYEIGGNHAEDLAGGYEDNMEDDLEAPLAPPIANGSTDADDVEMGQFDDVDQPEM